MKDTDEDETQTQETLEFTVGPSGLGVHLYSQIGVVPGFRHGRDRACGTLHCHNP